MNWIDDDNNTTLLIDHDRNTNLATLRPFDNGFVIGNDLLDYGYKTISEDNKDEAKHKALNILVNTYEEQIELYNNVVNQLNCLLNSNIN